MRQRRAALDPEVVARASATIQARVLALASFKAATVIGVYKALPHEVQTGAICDEVLARGKCLCVPAPRPAPGRGYGLAHVSADTAWRPGPLGVPQPAALEWVALTGVDLVVVPGVAFDRQGGRLGHGGGHMDRLLAEPGGRNVYKVGLAFAFQLVAGVPVDTHDIQMDLVISDS